MAWCEKQIQANRLMGERCGIAQIAGFVPGEVHVYKGAATLADAIGVPYTVTIDSDATKAYPVTIAFQFDGFAFFQIEKDVADATDVRNS